MPVTKMLKTLYNSSEHTLPCNKQNVLIRVKQCHYSNTVLFLCDGYDKNCLVNPPQKL